MSQKNYEANFRNLGIIAFGILVFTWLFNVLLGGHAGLGYNHYYGQGLGINFNGLIASVFLLAIKLLWLVLIVSLAVGVWVLLKKHYTEKKFNFDFINSLMEQGGSACPGCGAKAPGDFKFCSACGTALKISCAGCGNGLHPGWKCCPACGKEAPEVKEVSADEQLA